MGAWDSEDEIGIPMAYLIEKQVIVRTFHPHSDDEHWVNVDDKLLLEDAKKTATEYAIKIEKGKYRVRDVYSGKVLFNVPS